MEVKITCFICSNSDPSRFQRTIPKSCHLVNPHCPVIITTQIKIIVVGLFVLKRVMIPVGVGVGGERHKTKGLTG